MLVGTYRIGEDIALALDAVEGDAADIVTITAFMVAGLGPTRPFVRDPSKPRIPMMVASRPATAEFPAGWNVILPAAQTRGLKEGIYQIDAKLIASGGSTNITDTSALVRLTASAFQ